MARTRGAIMRRETKLPAEPTPIPFLPAATVTDGKQRAFLIAYAHQGNISRAAHTIGISRDTHYHWAKTDPVYAAAAQQAHEHAMDQLEEVARLRGVHGSDVLIIFLLKGGRPEKYRDRQELTGPNGTPLGPSAVVHVSYHNGMEPPPDTDSAKTIEKKRRQIVAAAPPKKP